MIKVLIVDDHPLVCEGMSVMFSSEHDFSVLGTAEDGEEALAICRTKGTPDVAIVDIRMKGMNGFLTLAAFKQYMPKVKVLMLAGMPLKSELDRAMREGAAGYLPKSAPSSKIVAAVRAAAAGEGFQEYRAVRPRQNDILTDREMQVLVAINDGLTCDEISAQLDVGFETVKSHARSMRLKLGAPSSAAAVGKAYELGILGGPKQ